ncbi:tetratricopeptide repeat protein [Saccharothrix lopnurensis]|uniref:Tetratricopeptide repeat protein n=1 Tax=Saccharothrix lopnurensis TaxID=1670621 RepID=A0ABW1NYD3_9PSEU
MTSFRVTEEHIAAAQLRLVVDQKLGRETPDIVREIAAMTSAQDVIPAGGDSDPPQSDPAAAGINIKVLGPVKIPSDSQSARGVVIGGVTGDAIGGPTAAAKLARDLADIVDRHPEATEDVFNAVRRMAQTNHDYKTEVLALNRLASLLAEQGRHAEAIKHYQQVRELARTVRDQVVEVAALTDLAAGWASLDRNDQASRVVRQARNLAREVGHHRIDASTLTKLGNTLAHQGQHEDAADVFRSMQTR